ncbi:MAG TPA: hypothetical protein PKD05_09305, partial [Candidatus Melainabacteria bacterium]|nr:hypothetical protein [Candidatus Melainabacteria bacterium]
RRAGADDRLMVVIDDLKKRDKELDQDLLSTMAAILIDRREWCSLQRFLRAFPQAEPDNAHDYVVHQIENVLGKAGVSQSDLTGLNQWFNQVSGLDDGNPSLVWLREYLGFLKKKQPESVGTVLAKLADIVKENPGNFEYASIYVSLVSEFQPRERQDLSWLVEKLAFPGVYENYKFGELLTPVSGMEAVKFYRKALTMKLNDQDRKFMDKYLRNFASAYFPETVNERAEEELRLWTRAGLARALKESGDVDGAFKVLVSLAKVNKVGMPVYALTELAGQVQSTVGDGTDRELEKQVLGSERASGHSFSYWLSRADYFEGAGDRDMVEKAYARAMALTDLGSSTTVIYSRVAVVSAYRKNLKRRRSEQAALAFLWREFDDSDNIRYRGRLLDMVFSDSDSVDSAYRPSSDHRLFEYLDKTSAWKKTEKVLIERILKDASPSESSMRSAVSRLYELARSSGSDSGFKVDSTRAIVLSEALIKFDRGKEAVSLLQLSKAGAGAGAGASGDVEHKHQSKEINRLLFEAYLSVDDWRRAKQLWKVAAAGMAPLTLSDWAGRIALGAARTGGKEEALNLWRLKDEIDRTDLSNLKALADYGLKAALEKYYGLNIQNNLDLEPDYLKSARIILNSIKSN